MTKRIQCLLCNEWTTLADIHNHLHRHHPDRTDDAPDWWPDNGIIVIDLTLTPADITRSR